MQPDMKIKSLNLPENLLEMWGGESSQQYILLHAMHHLVHFIMCNDNQLCHQHTPLPGMSLESKYTKFPGISIYHNT